jgi:hypothetical protein
MEEKMEEMRKEARKEGCECQGISRVAVNDESAES